MLHASRLPLDAGVKQLKASRVMLRHGSVLVEDALIASGVCFVCCVPLVCRTGHSAGPAGTINKAIPQNIAFGHLSFVFVFQSLGL